jgi:glucosamine 6-phosphate synthetase-like amidotransferase/phosphosugar isomerase protein
MSGNVDRTVEAAQAVDAQGVPMLALVNGGGGRLGAIAQAKVSLDLADVAPFLCGTSSYTATVTALMLLAGGAAGARDVADRLAGAPDAAAVVLAGPARLVPERALTGARFLAAGPEMGTAQYGAAKLVELTHVAAWPGDLEEFAHSQYWAMPVSDLVIVIATNPLVARYATDACEALGQLGVATLAIDVVGAPVTPAAARVTLPSIEPTVAPLVSAIPLQRLAYLLAEQGGLDPNTRLHLKGDETRFRVSRLLTRRSLLGTGQ